MRNTSEAGNETANHPRGGKMPRWVKISAISAIVIVALVIIAMLVGGGEHSPSRHLGGFGKHDPSIRHGEHQP